MSGMCFQPSWRVAQPGCGRRNCACMNAFVRLQSNGATQVRWERGARSGRRRLQVSSSKSTPPRAGASGNQVVRHILVVDDEESLRHMLVVLLQREGYQATAVGSGESALAELTQRPYDVVLSDIRMPKLSGLELMDEIHKREIKTTVILM